MLIVTAQNVTHKSALTHSDGTADYEIWVGINQHRIWNGRINGHVREKGPVDLLRLIADKMDQEGVSSTKQS